MADELKRLWQELDQAAAEGDDDRCRQLVECIHWVEAHVEGGS